MHTSVHILPRSKNLAAVINDLDDWERIVEQFELCDGVISDNDRRTVDCLQLLGLQPSEVRYLRRHERGVGRRDHFPEGIWPRHWPGPHSHAVEEHAAADVVEQAENEDEEGTIELDLSNLSAE